MITDINPYNVTGRNVEMIYRSQAMLGIGNVLRLPVCDCRVPRPP